MIERKDKTVKQLQAECRKRKIGFMMSWTKGALIKRLEEEDKREIELLETKEELEKQIEVNKKTKKETQQLGKKLESAKPNAIKDMELSLDKLIEEKTKYVNRAQIFFEQKIKDRKEALTELDKLLLELSDLEKAKKAISLTV